jgi:hypothetical protein
VHLIWVLAGGKSPWRAPNLFDEKALFAVPRFRKINELVFSHPLKTSNSVPSDFGAKFPTLEAALSDRIEIEAINLGAGATLPRAQRWGIRTPTALLTDLRLSLKPSRGGYR